MDIPIKMTYILFLSASMNGSKASRASFISKFMSLE